MRQNARLGMIMAMGLAVAAPTSVWAQAATPPNATAPAAAPPPGYPQPPPGYAYVAIAPVVPIVPVVTAPVAQGYSPALELPYVAGQPIPNGYHVYEEPRRGLVVTGWVITGVSYGAALFAGVTGDFKNSSEYLVLPVAGPWLTLGRRDYAHCPTDGTPNDGLDCAGDAGAATGLIFDGILQAAGVTLLLTGYLAPKKKLVYFPSALAISPRRTAGGYGLTLSGAF